ncbi:MAG: TssQ family T6SS-associated lipoprotein [Burkholderiales bacterium]|nr:TssQ family T6SS-associated lipoprotein [Burkholderiales bacterium]
MMRRLVTFVTVSATLVLAGCAGLAQPGTDGGVAGTGAPGASAAAPVASVRPPEPTEGRKTLDRAVAQFEQGKFAEAIRMIQESPEIVADGPAVRTQSLKTLAFAQCVAGRRPACRRSFDALLVLDPSFELAPAETGHPSWGPEFDRARAAAKAVAPAAAVGSGASRR